MKNAQKMALKKYLLISPVSITISILPDSHKLRLFVLPLPNTDIMAVFDCGFAKAKANSNAKITRMYLYIFTVKLRLTNK